MKLFILIFSLLLVSASNFAQSGKKPPVKEKPPTQKELADMMKEMQAEINGMSAEDKKTMDSLGIKLPNFKTIPKVSDKQLAQALVDDERIVPKRDAARIAVVSKKVTDVNISNYISAVQKEVSNNIGAEGKNAGENVLKYIKSKSKNSSEAGIMTAALWLVNMQEMAVYTMGNICSTDPSNTDNLSNYASMLSMMGGQHLAIPILNNLNAKFPKNSTLLNNLGQAWFGLGEIAKAEKYLDSVIRIYAYHPQANLTMAAIEESKGNISKAIDHLQKSIKHSYTTEKEDKLRKLGHEIKLRDLRLRFKPGPDPLGLQKFKRPDYPRTLSELKMLKPMWEDFDRECDNEMVKLRKKSIEATEKYTNDLNSRKSNLTMPIHAKKALLQLDEITAHFEITLKRMAEKLADIGADLDKIQKNRKKIVSEAPCETKVAAENEFIGKYNDKKKEYDEEYLEVMRQYYNDLAYWSQYTSIDKNQFDLIVYGFQEGWLKNLKEYRPLLRSEFENLECAEKEEARPGKLADFDDVACNYNDTLNLGIIEFYNNCSRMTSKLDLKIIEYTRKDNFERAEGDTYMSSTVKFSAEKGFDELKASYGPLKVEAKVGASIEIEFDREGVKDINLALEAKAGAGINLIDEGLEKHGSIGGKDIVDTSVEIGVEGRFSIVSGKGNFGGSGALKGLTIIQW